MFAKVPATRRHLRGTLPNHGDPIGIRGRSARHILLGDVNGDPDSRPQAARGQTSRPPGVRTALLLGVAVVQLRELGLRRVGREVRLDDLIEPGVVLIDRVLDLNYRDATVFHDGVVGNKAVSLTLRWHGSSGDLIVRLGGHAGRVMLLEDCHRYLSLAPRMPGPRHAAIERKSVV